MGGEEVGKRWKERRGMGERKKRGRKEDKKKGKKNGKEVRRGGKEENRGGIRQLQPVSRCLSGLLQAEGFVSSQEVGLIKMSSPFKPSCFFIHEGVMESICRGDE